MCDGASPRRELKLKNPSSGGAKPRLTSGGEAASPTSTIFAGLGEVVVDHAATIFACFGDRSVATFFVAADLVLRVEAFEHELTGSNQLRVVSTAEFKRNQRRFQQFGNCFDQRHTLRRGRSVSQQQFVAFIKPLHSPREIDADKVALEDLATSAFD